jgi:5'-deoxynucleotidase YfbR-like HD superfamily hydrolase
MHTTRRYLNQKFWEAESQESYYATKVESGLRLESVAEHSWHIADIILLLAPHFPSLSLERCLALAVLHDKLEIYTGDYDPVGLSGTGEDTHAFSPSKKQEKKEREIVALEEYIAKLPAATKVLQQKIIFEYIEGKTQEAAFVNAIDKLQALCFVAHKKKGLMADEHIYFTVRYSRKCITYFPALVNHYSAALSSLLNGVSIFRKVDREELERDLFNQFEFNFE